MNKRSENKSNTSKEKDNTYSVERTSGTTIEELIDGIRDKIQHTLKAKKSVSDAERSK